MLTYGLPKTVPRRLRYRQIDDQAGRSVSGRTIGPCNRFMVIGPMKTGIDMFESDDGTRRRDPNLFRPSHERPCLVKFRYLPLQLRERGGVIFPGRSTLALQPLAPAEVS